MTVDTTKPWVFGFEPLFADESVSTTRPLSPGRGAEGLLLAQHAHGVDGGGAARRYQGGGEADEDQQQHRGAQRPRVGRRHLEEQPGAQRPRRHYRHRAAEHAADDGEAGGAA